MNDRRKALKVIAGCAGLGAVAVAVTPAAALVAAGRGDRRLPGAPRDDGGWTVVATLEQVVRGTPKVVSLEGVERDAWSVSPRQRIGEVWLLRGVGDTVTAFSAVCPHLGCIVERKGPEFYCACHHSHFEDSGRQVRGPSPRGLDPLPVRVQNGEIAVQWKRFRLNTPERIEEG